MENKKLVSVLEKNAEEKYEKLKSYLLSLEKIAVAFSGGVDSTFLLKAAKEVLGENVVAFIAISDVLTKEEEFEAEQFCKKEKINLVKIPFNVFSVKEFVQNPKERCYYCKTELMKQMKQTALKYGISLVVEGTNLDDERDYRPGRKALEEQKILSPLRVCQLTKDEIRYLSRKFGLATWNKPSFACLASRIPYGETITKELLCKVEKAERFLREKGFSQMRVRVYPSNRLVRLELLPEEQDRLFSNGIQTEVTDYMKELGFSYITLDLEGYRSGSMNNN